MHQMLRVIPIVWRAVRPSRVADMPAEVNSFWLPKGYEGLTFFGRILTPTEEVAERFNRFSWNVESGMWNEIRPAADTIADSAPEGNLPASSIPNPPTNSSTLNPLPNSSTLNPPTDPSLKNHEMIHLRQAQSTGDSWVRFYLLYIWYWLRALPANRWLRHGAYLLNPFELEAYRRMYDLAYLQKHPEGCTEWRQYARMSLRERLKVWTLRPPLTPPTLGGEMVTT